MRARRKDDYHCPNGKDIKDVDDYHKSQRKQIRASLKTFDALTDLILEASIDDITLRKVMFDAIGKDLIIVQKEAVDTWRKTKG